MVYYEVYVFIEEYVVFVCWFYEKVYVGFGDKRSLVVIVFEFDMFLEEVVLFLEVVFGKGVC